MLSKWRTSVRSERGDWEYRVLREGAIHFRKSIDQSATQNSLEAYGPSWLFGFVSLGKGEAFYVRNEKFIQPVETRWAVFYPPYSVARSLIKDAQMEIEGVWSTDRLPDNMPRTPVIIPILEEPAFPCTTDEVVDFLKKSENLHSPIAACSSPSVLSTKIKSMIESLYHLECNLSGIANELNTSSSQLSRSFKKDFGISPVFYRNHLRVEIAKFRLLNSGSSIITIGGEVGFQDHSQFYKVMKKYTLFPPGMYRKRKPFD